MRIKQILLILVILYCTSIQGQGEDLYKILGVKKDATEDQIKKAFKKQAIKHHPDKNKDDPEGAKVKFQKIAHAYETLSDKEKREIYDQYGEEGVKRQSAGADPRGGGFGGGGGNFGNMNFDDIFKQFFGQQQGGGFPGGGGGGGRRGPKQQGGHQQFQFNFGGGGFPGQGQQHQQQQEQQQKAEDIFENSDVISLNINELSQFYRRKEIWVVLFKKDTDEECKKLKDEYRELAEKMYGIIKVAAVDCEEDEEVCEEFGVYSVPTMMIYSESYSDDGEKYTGQMNWKSIATFATRKMQSFVSIVSNENYEQFILREPTKYKVLLFTERKSTAPIFKALSKQYKDKLFFGEVRKSETQLIEKFKIEKFPTLLVVTSPYDFQGETFNGDIKIDQLTKFLNNYSYKVADYSKKMELQELTYNKYKVEGICGKKSSTICIIGFTDDSTTMIETLKPLIDLYQNDPLQFVYVNKLKERKIHEQFGQSRYHLAAYKPKRGRFIGYSKADLSQESIKDFINDILGGSGHWERFEDSELIFSEQLHNQEL